MIFEQYYLGCLAQASYLIGDAATGTAVVVDPRRDVQPYVDDAERHGVTIHHVILTHFHADFVAGHLELQARTGARIVLGAQAAAEYPFDPVRDGDVMKLGRVRLEFLETPGHTPESICIVVYDEAADAEQPYAVLTGDTLFIGDVGRPDLMASAGMTPEELAGQLYDSLHGKLLRLPDATRVYPGHGAGSLCGKNLGRERVSTLGDQRRFNPALQPQTRDAFVQSLTRDLPEAPEYFAHDAALNRRQRATLEETLARALRPLGLEEVLRLTNAGAQLLDTRPEDDYAMAHVFGSTWVGLDGSFASWCGTVLDRERPIVLLCEPGSEEEATMRLGRIGFDHVAGYLEGGFTALDARPDLVRHTPRLTAQALAERLSSPEPPQVLDVRSEAEWQDRHLVGCVHVPLPQLRARMDEVPRNSHVVIHCAMGYRSLIAASLLEQQGLQNFSDLKGGYLAWELTELGSR